MRALTVLSFGLLAAAGGCDLVPVSEVDGYCDIDETGRLVVTVRNQGRETAAASTTRVEYWFENEHGTGFLPVELPTPSLLPGEEVQLAVPFHPSLCNPDSPEGCLFFIIVDAYDELLEDDEDNNFAIGACSGSG